MTTENNILQLENKTGKLEEFANLIDQEKFSEAKNLAQKILATGDFLTKAILNSTGYEVVDKYLHSNKEKAKRICEAFPEYSWQNWLE